MWILQNQRACGYAQHGVQRIVGVGDFDLAVAGEGLGRPKRKGELLVDGQVVLVCEMDGRVVRVLDPLAEQNDGGPRGGDRDGQGEYATVIERESGGQLFAGVKFRCGAVRRKRETKRFRAGCFGCCCLRSCDVGAGSGAGVKMRPPKASCLT